MDFAEDNFLAAEGEHVWGEKSDCLVFDKKALDCQQRQQQDEALREGCKKNW